MDVVEKSGIAYEYTKAQGLDNKQIEITEVIEKKYEDDRTSPHKRNGLLYTIRNLSDLEYQEKLWLDGKYPGFYRSLYM